MKFEYACVEGALSFDSASKRWHVQVDGFQRLELTSGNTLEVKISGVWVPIRIEHQYRVGYVAVPHAVRLHDGLTVRVTL